MYKNQRRQLLVSQFNTFYIRFVYYNYIKNNNWYFINSLFHPIKEFVLLFKYIYILKKYEYV